MLEWDTYWSAEGRSRQPAMLHSIVQRFSALPDVIGMHGGLPPPDAFPLTSVTATLSDGSTLTLDDPRTITASQQYNLHAKGYPPLQAWFTQITQDLHHPPCNTDTIITPGATAALDGVMRLLLNPGDPILLEEFTYSHALESLFIPAGYELLSVPLDHKGLCPKALDALLQQRHAAGLALPRVLYTIPTGQNPTGVSVSPERRAEVYRVAQAWGLVIVEDDAYYWLQYPDGAEKVPGLKLPAGYLALDTDGRVVRVDTLAKLLGPGFRLGWVTAAPRLIAKLALIINATSIGAASFSQVLVQQLLAKWGRDGFEEFLVRLQRKYARQVAVAAAAATEHLRGLVEWRPTTAGMFLWFKLTGVSDADEVLEAGVKQQVVVVPGKIFWAAGAASAASAAAAAAKRNHLTANGTHTAAAGAVVANGDHYHQQQQQQNVEETQPEPCPYFRVSFVSAAPEQLQEGFKRLGVAIRSCMGSTGLPSAAGDDGAVAATKVAPEEAAAAAPQGPEEDVADGVAGATTASKLQPSTSAAAATAAAPTGSTAPAAAVATDGRPSIDADPARPWLPADEGRLRVPSYFLAAAAAAPELDAIVPGAEPVEAGVDDQGLSAAAGVEEKRAAAEGREPLAARTSSSGTG